MCEACSDVVVEEPVFVSEYARTRNLLFCTEFLFWFAFNFVPFTVVCFSVSIMLFIGVILAYKTQVLGAQRLPGVST